MSLNIDENRSARKYSCRVQVARILWGFGKVFFRLTPRPLYTIRSFILRCFGASVGHNVNISNTANIYFPWNLEIGDWSSIGDHALVYNLGVVRIGNMSTISQRTHVCAGSHDYCDPTLPLLKPPVNIGSQVWVCADSFIGPGVSVNDGAVVGARSVVTKDVEQWSVVAGNPAKTIKRRVLNDRK
ncbi:Maltose O-acetyltransferase [Vibrio mediterranei]|uniref:acetyltransferase n=1 Tax=Vibrio mediterranei TaxID=689 RepID=UPI000782DA3F|nr:acetyltransferase [Vibrio mediterranei]SBO12203.1 Maltose O-acetyltransferase [Vibrio mediterranei]